jgi:hypothetical protein
VCEAKKTNGHRIMKKKTTPKTRPAARTTAATDAASEAAAEDGDAAALVAANGPKCHGAGNVAARGSDRGEGAREPAQRIGRERVGERTRRRRERRVTQQGAGWAR